MDASVCKEDVTFHGQSSPEAHAPHRVKAPSLGAHWHLQRPALKVAMLFFFKKKQNKIAPEGAKIGP